MGSGMKGCRACHSHRHIQHFNGWAEEDQVDPKHLGPTRIAHIPFQALPGSILRYNQTSNCTLEPYRPTNSSPPHPTQGLGEHPEQDALRAAGRPRCRLAILHPLQRMGCPEFWCPFFEYLCISWLYKWDRRFGNTHLKSQATTPSSVQRRALREQHALKLKLSTAAEPLLLILILRLLVLLISLVL